MSFSVGYDSVNLELTGKAEVGVTTGIRARGEFSLDIAPSGAPQCSEFRITTDLLEASANFELNFAALNFRPLGEFNAYEATVFSTRDGFSIEGDVNYLPPDISAGSQEVTDRRGNSRRRVNIVGADIGASASAGGGVQFTISFR